MKHRLFALGLFLVILVQTVDAAAGPILKPRKYHGPIPQNSVMLRVGFLGGADNTEMIEFLDGRRSAPFKAFSEDFDNAWMVDGTFTRKMHPQFAVRANLSAAFLRSTGDGNLIPPRPAALPDTIHAPIVNYTRNFDVDLFIVEASALYFFTDAAVKEFQPYIGGGFSLGIPHAKFKQVQTVGSATDAFYTQGEVYGVIDTDKWSAEAGVHGILGALYYFWSSMAVTLEGRYQVLQSKYPLEVTNENGLPETVKFDVDYVGFVLNFGIAYSF